MGLPNSVRLMVVGPGVMCLDVAVQWFPGDVTTTFFSYTHTLGGQSTRRNFILLSFVLELIFWSYDDDGALTYPSYFSSVTLLLLFHCLLRL